MATVVRAYKDRFPSRPKLHVAPVFPGDDFAATAGAVPAWLGALDLGDKAMRALVAAVGAYASAPAKDYSPRRRSSVGEVVGSVALAVAANSARDRSAALRGGNTISGERPLAPPDHQPWPALQVLAPDLFPGRLLALETCGGALFAGLARLNQTYPKTPFTEFVRSVAEANFSGPLRADPDCSGEQP